MQSVHSILQSTDVNSIYDEITKMFLCLSTKGYED